MEIRPRTLVIRDLMVMNLNCSVPQKYHSQANPLTNKNETEKNISLQSPSFAYKNERVPANNNMLMQEVNRCMDNNSETMVFNSCLLSFFLDISLMPYVTIPNSAITIK